MVTLRCKQNGIGKAIFAQNIPRKTQVFKRRLGVYFRKDALRRNPELYQRFLCGFALALRLVLALPAGRDTNGFSDRLLDTMLQYPHDIETRD